MGLFRRRRRDDQPVDPEERSPQLGIKYKDLMVLGQLQSAGADLEQPRHVVYYLYAPSPAVQAELATAATARGFEVETGEPLPGYPDAWRVRCETTVALIPDVVRDNTDFFETLAASYGAEYDGWEAATG